jgi:hypothetical protein
MKQIIGILILSALISAAGFTQDIEVYSLRTGVGFVPQYTISGGLRFDIDLSISKSSNQWLIVSPQVFVVSGWRYDHEFKNLTGFGLDLKHRVFLKPQSMKPSGYYVEYGAMFQYFSITDTRTYSTSYIEDGTEYFTVKEGEINTNLYKFGGNFHLGHQWLIGDKVYIDMYAGAGIRISHNNRNEGFDTWYNNFWIDYGYSGTLLDGGFRLGFYF